MATAIHNGHNVRPETEKYFLIDEFDRLREEDPYTEYFTQPFKNRIIVTTSRFEVDVNRPRDGAIYKSPDQSWGINVWKENVPVSVWQDSLEEYDFFYDSLKRVVDRIVDFWGYVIVYDIHSYNHRRKGPYGEEANPAENPDVNVGTASMNRDLWGEVVERFMGVIDTFSFNGRNLQVAENVRFKGGFLANWIHSNYPDKSCVLSIEFKKIFMDEWTGAVDIFLIDELRSALSETMQPVLDATSLIKTGRGSGGR